MYAFKPTQTLVKSAELYTRKYPLTRPVGCFQVILGTSNHEILSQ